MGGPTDAAGEQVAVLRAGVSLLIVAELDIENPGAAVLARPGDRFVVVRVIRRQQDVVALGPPSARVGFIVDREVFHAAGNRVVVVADSHGDILVALALAVRPQLSIDFHVEINVRRADDLMVLWPTLKRRLRMVYHDYADSLILQESDKIVPSLLGNMRDEFTELDITAVRSFSCWVASLLLDMEKRFLRIMDYQQL